jgi:hypothetical protein
MKENRTFLPCPFCGAEAKCMNDDPQSNRLGAFGWYVGCVKCHISTPLSDWHTVREMWNRRVEGKHEDR